MPDPAQLSTPSSVQPSASNRDIVTVLVEQGVLTTEVAQEVRSQVLGAGKKPADILAEKNLASSEAIAKAKATLYSIPFVSLSQVGVAPEALTKLSEGVARSYRMFPFAYNQQTLQLSVAMADPLDLVAIDFAQQKTGLKLVAHYADPLDIDRMTNERYAQNLSSEVTQALEESTQFQETKISQQDLSELSGGVIRQAPISKIVETILAFAVKARSSDVHIEPQVARTRVRYRIDGILNEKLILPRKVHDAVVSRIKILSQMKIDEKRIPQDGRFNFTAEGREVDLRVSSLPTIHGEKIVMRLLQKDVAVPTLPELGLTGVAQRDFEDALQVPHGIILVTGPTGSGKTTTLYSALYKINTPKVNVITLEDPVEYQIPGVNQVQINPQAGLTFASGLRSFLRQDPNVIMVGEIRDSETAELAIQASLTGHLVFSTLHTSSAAASPPRMLDMGVEPFLLASTMTLIVGQRVVRLINPNYKEEYKPDPAVLEDIKNVLGEQLANWCKAKNKKPEDITLFRTRKDLPPDEPEYRGRIAIFEVMKVSEKIGSLILEQAPATQIEREARKNGMLLMKQDGYIKALEGLTTIEEVLRVAQI